uniref:Uncharacterized protein n=1 Tax=Picea sitchensis TaxID=3332 RepID=D5A9J9_PICSI|nr:unknown [Picea sitchensis]
MNWRILKFLSQINLGLSKGKCQFVYLPPVYHMQLKITV